MKAVILAAGYATRLYPLTKNKAKPLLPVGNKLMIEWIIGKIKEVPEINEIIIVTNSKFYEDFKNWAENKKGIKILNDGTTSNEDRLGVVDDIIFAIEAENITEDLMIVGGDNLFEFDLNKLVTLSKEKKASTIAAFDVKTIEEARKLGNVISDENGKISDIEEKPQNPKSTLAATLCYFIRAEDIPAAVSQKNTIGIPLPKLIMKTKPVYAVVYTAPWYDIGSHEQYKEVNKIYKK
ncbi:nucleotidyltransferase family protein [Candidatus Woesearchaeota archaeon]|nr:nucleotidyltransferase family protein [Candidatus Woesearchaeota archaeon]MBW3005648.1 nucleotidyltransferase family protein [Candidatus Woesearchaeota archaeon]